MGYVIFGGGRVSIGSGDGGNTPPTGLRIGTLAVGSSVYLNEVGTPVEYLIVNQGIPSSSNLYDNSCDGTWLLRKDSFESRNWHSSAVNDYKSSTICSYLNSTFIDRLDAAVKSIIKTVKIPYVNGTGTSPVASGVNGLSTQVFLLSCPELNEAHQYINANEGSVLSYFSDCAVSAADSKRIANLNGVASNWWTRSPYTGNTTSALYISTTGGLGYGTGSAGVRPALILPSTTLVDENTMEVGGSQGNSGSGGSSGGSGSTPSTAGLIITSNDGSAKNYIVSNLEDAETGNGFIEGTHLMSTGYEIYLILYENDEVYLNGEDITSEMVYYKGNLYYYKYTIKGNVTIDINYEGFAWYSTRFTITEEG